MSSFKSIISKNVGTLSLVLMLFLSLGFNVYLAGRVNFNTPPATIPIKVNAQLPSTLQLLDADGKPTQLAFNDARPTVIYVFSPQCPWCKKNEANIKSIVAEAGSRYRIIGLSTLSTGLKQYMAEGHTPFPVYLIKSPDQMRKLGLVGTPETLVVNSGAKVEQVWSGAYLDPNKEKVEKFFDVKLPGLQQIAAVSHEVPTAN